MKQLFIVLAALALWGCGDPNGAKPMTKIKYVSPKIVPECLSEDPVWIDPKADQDETRSAAAWRDHQNKTDFNAMRDDRATCRAGLQPLKGVKS